MDVETIAAKLRPLMPAKVDQWMHTRQMADPELKSLIEKQIFSTAYKILGNFNEKILLSLPPEQKAKGPIGLGTLLYDKEKWPLGLTYGELIQNMAILGRSGAGKTNATFHILGQLINQNIPFVFLDWKRTARHLIPAFPDKLNVYTPGRTLSPFPFNPFVIPPGTEPNVYAGQVVDVLSDAFTLGDGSRSLLRKALACLYQQGTLCPTPADIITQLDTFPDKGRAGGWKVTALRALESLDFAALSSKDPIDQEQLAQQMLHSNTIIELDALGQESKKFLVPLLCLWLYSVRLKSPEREQLKLVIFIEEAHHVLHKHAQTSHETILEMLLRQCRELGIGIVVIDQHPHLLSSAALGNTYTTIFLNQKDPSDISKAAAVCLMDAGEKHYFSRLPTGESIVKLQDRWTSPVHVRFPLVHINKGLISDAMLARYSAGKRAHHTGSGRKTSVPTYFGQVRQVRLYDIPLNDDALHLLRDIVLYPDDGVKIRYKRLGLSVGKGNDLKTRLIDQGWLECQTVELGQTRKVLLRLTGPAKASLGIETAADFGSLIHEYWKRCIGQRFCERGYRIAYEVPRRSGRADLVAEKENEKIAIEIETGKSDFLNNVRQDLLAKYSKVLVVATDKTAYTKIQTLLARAGLLIGGKVEVALRDAF